MKRKIKNDKNNINKNNQKLCRWIDGSMLGETACNKRVGASAAHQFDNPPVAGGNPVISSETRVAFKRCARSC